MTRRMEVQWDTDGEDVGLPRFVDVPNDVFPADNDDDNSVVADWLSDEYGWCVLEVYAA